MRLSGRRAVTRWAGCDEGVKSTIPNDEVNRAVGRSRTLAGGDRCVPGPEEKVA